MSLRSVLVWTLPLFWMHPILAWEYAAPAFRCLPLVDPDDTPLKTPLSTGYVYSASSVSELTVLPHLQELFNQTVNGTQQSLSYQQSLAAVMRRNSNAFATGPMDLRFCAVLQHYIGDSQPIKQLPYCPPLLARDAEDDISDEMLQTGITMPSTSPRSSPVCMMKKKDGSYRFCMTTAA